MERKRFKILFIFIGILYLVLFLRLIYLTVITKYEKGRITSNENLIERGDILDVNLQKLAISIKVYSIFANPHLIKNISKTKINTLAKILNIDKTVLRKKFSKDKTFIWIKRKISKTVLNKIIKLKIRGISYIKEYKRFYPNGRLASHILGITGIDNVGLEGVELYYNKYLSAIKNEKKNIVLTIDKNIQYILENELRKAYKATRAKSITGIIIEPKTGCIIAMANMPDFNPNTYQKYPYYIRKNNSISVPFEPGSIFKIISSASVLSENAVNIDEMFYCPGYKIIGDKKIKCWKKHGHITFAQVIKESCNVGIIDATLKISRFKFYDYIRNFGIGTYTGIDLPGESKGYLRSPKGMGLFSQAAISLGQEVSATALQLIVAASVIFNDGKLVQPHIVKSILNYDGSIFKEFTPIVIRQVISPNISMKIRKLLQGVLEEGGTGILANIKGYSIAGKTGTGEIYDKKIRKYNKDKVNSSFVGFVPIDNAKYGIIISIHEPKTKDKSGGKLAAPVFKRIVEKLIAYKPLEPRYKILNKYNKLKVVPDEYYINNKTIIPDFKGKNMRDAIRILKQLHLRYNLIGSGFAYKQIPTSGRKIGANKVITIWFKVKK